MNENIITLIDNELTDQDIKNYVVNIMNDFFAYSNYRVNRINLEWCNNSCWQWYNSKQICTAKCRNLRLYDNSLKSELIDNLIKKLIEEKEKWNFTKNSINNYILENYINIKITNILNKK